MIHLLATDVLLSAPQAHAGTKGIAYCTGMLKSSS